MPNLRFFTVMALVLTAAATRLIPHPPNFTALGACALFAGAHFQSGAVALIVPLGAMCLADLALGNSPSSLMLFTYGSFALTVYLGRRLRQRSGPVRIATAALFSATIFFAVSNFGVWLLPGHPYPRTGAGLLACYLAAIPFFKTMLAADLLYTAVLFGSFRVAERYVGVMREPTQLDGAECR